MKKRVAVVGATGIAGQQCLVALDRHPRTEVERPGELVAHERAGVERAVGHVDGQVAAEIGRDGKRKVSLSWTASTDNVGVAGYIVYLNDAQLATTTTTSTCAMPARRWTRTTGRRSASR